MNNERRKNKHFQRDRLSSDEAPLLLNNDDDTTITLDVRLDTSARRKVLLF